jgi:isoleucyl-tRNA synthetase
MGTLWNTYAFFVLYANIDGFDASKYTLDYDKLSVMDKWMISKLNTLIKTSDDYMSNYKITEVARVMQSFVDDMSNWYVRRSRERFWAKGMEQDKINAYMTLYTVLTTFCKLAAPLVPFITEDIYQNLVRSIDKTAPESIHLCDYPVANDAWINPDMEAEMDEVLQVVTLGRNCRNAANIKNRQPIAAMYVKGDRELGEEYKAIVADELNIREVRIADSVKQFLSYSFKPQLKTVGPKYGKYLNAIRTALTELNGSAAMDELETNGCLKLNLEGAEIVLAPEDLLIESAQTEGYESCTDNGVTVVLDTTLTPELIEEGFVREIISKVQTMRKESDFQVTDHIAVYVFGNAKIEEIFRNNEATIRAEVLADAVEYTEPTAAEHGKEWNINGEKVTLGVKVL